MLLSPVLSKVSSDPAVKRAAAGGAYNHPEPPAEDGMRPKHLRFVALGLGIVCLLAMFKPGYSHETPGPGEEYTRFRLGLPSSPWFHWDAIHIDKRVESPAGVTHTFSNRTEYGF